MLVVEKKEIEEKKGVCVDDNFKYEKVDLSFSPFLPFFL